MLYYYILMLPVTVVLFWIFIFTRLKGEQLRAQALFIAFMFCLIVNGILSATIISGLPVGMTHYVVDYLDSFAVPLLPPLIYLHLKHMTADPRFNWKNTLLFIPALIVGFGNLIFGLQMGYDGFVQHHLHGSVIPALDLTNPTAEQLRWFFNNTLYNWVMILQLLILGTMATIYLKRYRSRLEDFYANVENKSFHHIRNILLWVITWVVFAVLAIILQRRFFTAHTVLAIIYAIGFTMIQSAVCHNNYLVEFTSKDLEKAKAEVEEEATSEEEVTIEEKVTSEENTQVEVTPKEVENHIDYSEIKQALDDWSHREDKPYLNDRLTVATVAKQSGVRQRAISAYLNSELHINFNMWVNSFRIIEAKRLLAEPKNLTMLDIATQCGVTDPAAFTRLFKKHTGITPSEYRKKVMTA